MRQERRNLHRRDFLKAGLTAMAALPVVGVLFGPRSARAESVTEIEAMQPLVQGLQYTPTSEKPDQTCANCFHYTPGEGGTGKCAFFTEGTVTEGGWCASWTAKG